jgi:hypothetical protein
MLLESIAPKNTVVLVDTNVVLEAGLERRASGCVRATSSACEAT